MKNSAQAAGILSHNAVSGGTGFVTVSKKQRRLWATRIRPHLVVCPSART